MDEELSQHQEEMVDAGAPCLLEPTPDHMRKYEVKDVSGDSNSKRDIPDLNLNVYRPKEPVVEEQKVMEEEQEPLVVQLEDVVEELEERQNMAISPPRQRGT